MAKISLYNLCEFLYDGFVRRGRNFLFDRLDREDFLKVKNESKIRTFVEKAKLEDLMILASKINIGCGIVFWDKETEKFKKVEDVLIAYIETDPNDVTKQIIKDKVYAAVDIDIIKGLQVISKASNSATYGINRKYLHIKENAGLKTRTLVNKLQAEEGLEWYSKIIQSAFDVESILEPFKINIFHFRILLALHTAPNGFTKEGLQRKLDRINITGMLNEMYQMALINYSPTNKNVVTIDVYGVMVLEQIFAKFP